ncbi:MAG: hypothetical protein Q9220_000247 [cf. Caloplaca sp. 1 TL-2023]
MDRSGATPKVEDLSLSDDDTDALFASPSRPDPKSRSKSSKAHTQEVRQKRPNNTEKEESGSEEAREAVLRKELAGLRNINHVVESAVDSLEKAQGDVNVVLRTVHDASALLNTWTRILSQTEHNQRLIMDPSWRGATQDMADLEHESLFKQREQERQELEEAQRREARARKAEEDERKKLEHAAMKTPRGARGSARATPRGRSSSQLSSQSAATGTGASQSSRVARAGSAIGRGANAYRGRSRGS